MSIMVIGQINNPVKTKAAVVSAETPAASVAAVQKRGSTPRIPREGDEQIARLLGEYVRRRSARTEDTVEATGRRVDVSLSELKGRIAHHHTALVESIARRFINSGEPFEDLVQEGFLGLLSALENFSPDKGVRFTTYATHFIAGAIRHCLRDRGKIIKEPAWLNEVAGKVNRTSETLTQQLGRTPHAAEIAQVLNLTETAVEEILATRQVFQVAAFASASDDSDTSLAGLVDPEKIRADRYNTLQLPIEDRIVLQESALKLKALEQKVLQEFFYKDHNQTEIAKQLGISCNYVSHILKNSTQKLRRMLGEAEVKDRTRSREGTIIDPATGLYTQAHILARAGEELSRAARASQKVALLVVSVEGLPQGAGYKRDEAWTACGDAVRKSIRRMDLAGRFDGESLLVVLPNTGAQASVVAARLGDILMASGAAHRACFTVRVGVGVYPEQGRAVGELLAYACADAGVLSDDTLPVLPAEVAA